MNTLIDPYGRQITYLRLAVTDRCNLRCQYCMPEQGIDIVPRQELLTFKEMYRITRVLSELGVNKVRLTGGEPFVRKDFISLVKSLSHNDHLDEINITTNGALVKDHIETLEKLKVKSINLSIDSLQSKKFLRITRRDQFSRVWDAYLELLKSSLQLKLNVVVQSGFNTDEIVDFVNLTEKEDIAVRFIEEMPFNGKGLRKVNENWDFNRILEHISEGFENFDPVASGKSSTSRNYRVKGYKGTFGIIPAFTRTICNDCNRIRITATGLFKNCLFDDGVFDLKPLLRSDASDEDLKRIFIETIGKKPRNGFEAEANRANGGVSESMSTIGG
ncbi:MAG: GTP 3',8-cyclase MoaA [Lutimonas sp.]